MNEIVCLKKVWKYAKKYKYLFLISYIVLLIELFFSQLQPKVLETLIDAAIYKTDFKIFINTSIIYMVVFGCRQSCDFIQLQFWQRIHNKYVYTLKKLCIDRLVWFKASVLTNCKTGDLLHTINDDVAEFHHIIQRCAMRVVNAGIGSIVSLVIVASMSWQIGLLIAIIIPVSIVLIDKLKKQMKIISREVRDEKGKVSSWLFEILRGISEIKLFAVESSISEQYNRKNINLYELGYKQNLVQAQSEQMISGIYFFSEIVFYIIAALFIINDTINIAEYIAISAYYKLISDNFSRILRENITFQSRIVSIERVFSILEQDIEGENGLDELTISNGDIEIKNISFSYDDGKKVFDDLSVHITPGKHIGIVGESGIGKSTLTYLLLKFYSSDKGKIYIDGQDLSKCKCSYVRNNIGIVNQENIIFDGTIKYNICLDSEASDEEIWKLLDSVYLKKEVSQLQDGIYSKLGENGIELSGGQKQRIAIARAMYKNSSFLIFDESTSALDKKSEEIVLQAMEHLMAGKTSLIISHRLSNLEKCDEILVLKEGKIAERGTLNELKELKGEFYSLFYDLE